MSTSGIDDEFFYTCDVSPFQRKKNDGSKGPEAWRAFFSYKDEDGNRRRKAVTLKTIGYGKLKNGKPSMQARDRAKAEAENLRRELNEKHAREESLALSSPRHRLTVSECIDLYISECNIQRSTESSYRGYLKCAIAPKLGNIALDALTKKDCKEWADWIVTEYSRTYASCALRLLRAALSWACDEEEHDGKALAKRNPAQRVKLPKAAVDESAKKPNALTDAEQAMLLGIVDTALQSPDGYRNHVFMLAIKISLFTGLRRSEICALRWMDVDFDAAEVSVSQSIGHNNSEFYIKDPKSSSSRRTVPCPDELLQDLKRRKLAMKEECMALGIQLTGEHYVIGGADGSFLKPPRINDQWRTLNKNFHLMGTQNAPVSFHGLRHTFATKLIQSGQDVATVSAYMGHSKTSITLDRYASTSSKQMRQAAGALESAYGQTKAEHTGAGEVLQLKTGTED